MNPLSTFIIAVNLHFNNFCILGNSFTEGDNRFIFHKDPQFGYQKGKLDTNFDLLITDKFSNNDSLELVPDNRVFLFNRLRKDTQLRLISEAVIRLRNSSTRHFRHFDFPEFWTDAFSFIPDQNSHLIMKPLYGARGLGQIYVDAAHIDLMKFIIDLGRQDKQNFDKKEFEEKWGRYIKFLNGQERHKGESVDLIFNNDFVITKYIPDIVREYRLITNYLSEPQIVQTRIRKPHPDQDLNIAQATGVDEGYKKTKILQFEEILDEEKREDLLLLLRKVIGPLNAVDVYERENGQWGIFEYSPEFGYVDIPTNIIHHLYRSFIVDIVLRQRFI